MNNKHRDDPSKLSAHVHRIGYHFHESVFKQGCRELGYGQVNGKFSKMSAPASITQTPSGFERAMARYGTRFDEAQDRDATAEESKTVKSAIRELFPAIPQADLDEVFDRAWKKVRNPIVSG